jgi:AraC family transcriptional regulator, L-rhamnose operon regulatory protein RhaS
MRRYVIHEPFNIYHFEAENWQHPVHNHTYYEIIFILKGKGKHHLNGNTFDYESGDVFLLGPEDYHSFDIAVKTEYCYIRFMESFAQHASPEKDKNWQKTLKTLLQTPFQSRGSLVQDKSEKEKLYSLLKVLEAEYINRHEAGFELIRDNLMRTIMAILARNVVAQALPSRSIKSSSIEDMVLYVRENIHKPDLLRIEALAKKFNYAEDYVSIYFKKFTGEPLKQYIIKYKLKLVETRLLYSNAGLAKIADEFGFTDESHLCRQFRKYAGLSPGDFRNRNKRPVSQPL